MVSLSTSYTYDDNGDLQSATDPAGDTDHYGYNAAGEVVIYSGPLGPGQMTTHDYAGRTAQIVATDGSSQNFVYDKAGNLTSAADQDANGKACEPPATPTTRPVTAPAAPTATGTPPPTRTTRGACWSNTRHWPDLPGPATRLRARSGQPDHKPPGVVRALDRSRSGAVLVNSRSRTATVGITASPGVRSQESGDRQAGGDGRRSAAGGSCRTGTATAIVELGAATMSCALLSTQEEQCT